jgi:hypothetical protein
MGTALAVLPEHGRGPSLTYLVAFLLAHGCPQKSRRASHSDTLETVTAQLKGRAVLPEQGAVLP